MPPARSIQRKFIYRQQTNLYTVAKETKRTFKNEC